MPNRTTLEHKLLKQRERNARKKARIREQNQEMQRRIREESPENVSEALQILQSSESRVDVSINRAQQSRQESVRPVSERNRSLPTTPLRSNSMIQRWLHNVSSGSTSHEMSRERKSRTRKSRSRSILSRISSIFGVISDRATQFTRSEAVNETGDIASNISISTIDTIMHDHIEDQIIDTSRDSDSEEDSQVRVVVPTLEEEMASQKAIGIWQFANAKVCNCHDRFPVRSSHDEWSMAQITEFLQRFFPTINNGGDFVPLSLGLKRLTSTEFPLRINWRAILCGGSTDSRFQLNLQQSQTQCLRRFRNDPLSIRRDFDVDSVLAELPSLGTIKRGVWLTLYPKFGKEIDRSQNVDGLLSRAHEHLNFQLGRPAEFSRAAIYIIFPHTRASSASARPTNAALQLLIDEVFLSFIREEGRGLGSIFPRSFEDLRTKANAKNEGQAEENENQWSITEDQYFLRESLADRFWLHCQEKLENASGLLREFREPRLVLICHGLKQLYSDGDIGLVKSTFRSDLERAVHVGENELATNKIWVDFAIVDKSENEDITLLAKSKCNREWALRSSGVSIERGSGGSTTEYFHWLGTRDAGGVQTKPSMHNMDSGFVFNKRYNTWKDHFAINPTRGGGFFEDERGLIFVAQTDKFSGEIAAKLNSTINSQNKRANKARRQYVNAKNRMFTALNSTLEAHTSFDCRSEYRVTWSTFCKLSTDFSTSRLLVDGDGAIMNEDDGTLYSHQHLPYWVLDTQEVNRFAMATLNRFLLAIESIISRIDESAYADSLESQLADLPLLLALFGSTRMIAAGADLSRYPKLYKNRYAARASNRAPASVRRKNKDLLRSIKEREGDPDEIDDQDIADNGLQRHGLNFQQSLADTGMIWLPEELFDFEPRLNFAHDRCQHIAFVYGGLDFVPIQTLKIRSQLKCQSVFYTRLMTVISDVKTPNAVARKLAAELVVQRFIVHIFEILFERRCQDRDGVRVSKKEANGLRERRVTEYAEFMTALTEKEEAGLRGLDMSMIGELIECEPLLIFPRGAKKSSSPKAIWEDGTWLGSVGFYFAWSDDEDNHHRLQWEEMEYRQLAKYAYQLILSYKGEEQAELFRRRTLPKTAAEHVWILPNSDHTIFSKVERPKGPINKPILLGEHDERMEGDIERGKIRIRRNICDRISYQARTQWIVPFIASAEIRQKMIGSRRNVSPGEYTLLRRAIREQQRVVTEKIHRSSSWSQDQIVKDRRCFKVSRELYQADAFYAGLQS